MYSTYNICPVKRVSSLASNTMTMGKPFFTKTQKARMRERRKKKKVQGTIQTNDPYNTGSITTDQRQPVLKKRQMDVSSDDKAMDEPTNKRLRVSPTEDEKKQTIPDLLTRMVDDKILVTIPSNFSGKEAKKFRKDARRKLRMEGKEESAIEFVSADELSAVKLKKKKKVAFPSIKELLAEKQNLKEEEKQQKALKEIPDDVKAQYVAMDCEMVGIGTDGKKSALARVSLVDWDLNVVLDTFVQVPTRVTDFRTHVSGVTSKHIKANVAMDVTKCREVVANLLKGKILVGHALSNDLNALLLKHPKGKIRDTAKYRPFQRFGNNKWRPRKLRDLVKENLKGKEGFQEASHDSVQDARATMELFHLVYAQWEKEIAGKAK